MDFLEQVFKDGVIKGSDYIRIVEYSGAKKSSLRIRRDYALALNRLNIKYDCRPRLTYICGANLFARSSLNLFSGFVNQKFCFVDSVSDAFAAINSQKRKETKDKVWIRVSQKDIDEINELCGRMVWPEEETETMDLSPISQDNPLMELSETLTMVQKDLVDLRAIQAEQMKNIEQARKEAETASKAKGEFLANMSHEVRTPMNGVVGMLDVLSETQLTDEQQHFLEIARQSSVSLLGVVNDILDFSKVESKKITLETIDFDLRELMDSISDVLSLNAIENGLNWVA
jgi:signal transduction histidine kinase